MGRVLGARGGGRERGGGAQNWRLLASGIRGLGWFRC